jgi:FtsP/CotA-like multicopper oxidase with cupredoxin domain
MRGMARGWWTAGLLALAAMAPGAARADVFVQCPCLLPDPLTGKPDPTALDLSKRSHFNPLTGNIECEYTDASGYRNVACKALSAGDGHVQMGDGKDSYVFGFRDVTGLPVNQVMNMATDPTAPGGMRGAEASAPTINVREGQEFYLSLTNVGMYERPDLFDPHTVHFHGFPNAASFFDGEPMASIATNMGETVTYYYNLLDPGTYMYHCHVEAAEHMQMGMLGNLFVRARQDGTATPFAGRTYSHFAYDDCRTADAGCGSTGYDVSYPLEVTGFDPAFHHNDNSYNLVDFAAMNDTYLLLNGRGYPDTINPCGASAFPSPPANYPACVTPMVNSLGVQSQRVSALITAVKGQRILLRMPSLVTTEFYTLTMLGLPMEIVGQGARRRVGPTGLTYYVETASITLGGGEGADVIVDTKDAAPGTYFLYTSNLNSLSNDSQDYGGAMTEIVVSP